MCSRRSRELHAVKSPVVCVDISAVMLLEMKDLQSSAELKLVRSSEVSQSSCFKRKDAEYLFVQARRRSALLSSVIYCNIFL